MRLFCESPHTRVLSRNLSRNKKLPSSYFPIYQTYPLFPRKKTPSYRQIMFAYNKKGDYDIPMMSRHPAGHSRHRWGTTASPIRSFTNRTVRALDNGIREPLTIVTSTAVASTSAGVQPAMALHNVRVPPRGNQDGRCTASTTAHDHRLPLGGGPAPDCVQTYPVQGHRPSTTAPSDGQWACCVTPQGWRYASTSNVPVSSVPDTRTLPLGNGLRGDMATRRRRVVVDYAPSDVVVGSWETAAGVARMPGQDHPAASEAIRAVGQDRMGYRHQ